MPKSKMQYYIYPAVCEIMETNPSRFSSKNASINQYYELINFHINMSQKKSKVIIQKYAKNYFAKKAASIFS